MHFKHGIAIMKKIITIACAVLGVSFQTSASANLQTDLSERVLKVQRALQTAPELKETNQKLLQRKKNNLLANWQDWSDAWANWLNN